MYKTLKIGRKNFIISTGCCLEMLKRPHGMSSKKGKRFRMAFTTEQINYLEIQFKKFPYISNVHRKEVADVLNIPERAIKVWFQNRRMKEKKESTHKELNDETSKEMTMDIELQNKYECISPLSNQQRHKLCSYRNNSHSVNSISNNAVFSLNIGPPTQHLSEGNEQQTSSNACTTKNTFSESYPLIHHSKSPTFSSDICKNIQNGSRELKKSLRSDAIKEPENVVRSLNSKSSNQVSLEQSVPEDLSLNRKNCHSNVQESKRRCNEPLYLSVVPNLLPQIQTYYPNGVLWNPVNVMSTLASTPSALTLVNNDQGQKASNKETASNSCCDCKCHLKQAMGSNFQKQYSAPQYILTAIEMPNTSANVF